GVAATDAAGDGDGAVGDGAAGDGDRAALPPHAAEVSNTANAQAKGVLVRNICGSFPCGGEPTAGVKPAASCSGCGAPARSSPEAASRSPRGSGWRAMIVTVRRVSVVGSTGSGKTVFADALARKLGVPHVG